MLRRAATTIIVSFTLLAACSSDSTGSSGSTGAAPAASDSPAAAPTDGGAGEGGVVDCGATETAFGGAIVNIQILSQLPTQTDVTQWPTVVGTMPEFAAQLDVLGVAVAGDADATAAIEFYRGANDIAQRGYAGDATAPADLAAYLGGDLMEVLSKKTAIGIALDAADC
jgi:hypothetical protein